MKYELISTLKISAKGDIRLVRDKNGTLYVQRYRETDKQLLKKLMELDCPYIAKTVDYNSDENGFFTIEEYIEGTPTSETEFSQVQVQKVLTELCKAIKALHKCGIVHRDIKPSNIIFGKDGRIHLIDFDTARLMKEYQNHDTGYLGTIGYAPPEQYGFMQTDARSDIYAFGMTMEELLGKAASKPKFRRIIAKCTAFAPDKRYSDISLVERALKHQFSATAAIAICGALFIIAGVFLMSLGKEPQEHVSANLLSSEVADIPTTKNPPAPVIFQNETEETTEPVQTAEHTDISTVHESAEIIVDETKEIISHETQPVITTSQTEEQPVIENVIEIPQQDKMTFETLQDENGRNYDSYEYVFYDDPELHGSWVLCSTSRGIPEGEIHFPGTLEGYQPKYITVLPDGTLNSYNAGLRELNSFRWTNGYCIDDSTDIHKVERLFVLTNSDGTQYLIYERKPMYNGDDTMPHIYFIYKRVG